MDQYSVPAKFIDLDAQQKLIRPKIDLAIKKVLDHGKYIMGPEVSQFEDQLQAFTGARYAVTCANGTDALTICLMAWSIGPGDVVFMPSFTYVASAETAAQLGATPFFVDVSAETFNIDPLSFEQAVTDCHNLGLKPAAVVVVDLFGQTADIDAIKQVAHAHEIKVLVDGAQSFGATSKGRRVGTLGDATTTSFFPAKPLGCYGDGGAIFVDDEELATKIDSIRLHGKGDEKYDNVRIGVNSRLDTIQAAILLEKLKLFPKEIEQRNSVADSYAKYLPKSVRLPIISPDCKSVWAQYTVVVENRAEIQKRLAAHNIPSAIYYPKPLSQQDGYSHFPSVSSGLEKSEGLANNVLSLPMHPYLSESTVGHIAEVLGSHL